MWIPCGATLRTNQPIIAQQVFKTNFIVFWKSMEFNTTNGMCGIESTSAVPTANRHQAPTARNRTAQGNALGPGRFFDSSPEGAGTIIGPGKPITTFCFALSGLGESGTLN
jgi:hypothetical protein